MRPNVRFFGLVAVLVAASVAIPTLFAPRTHSATPYLSAIEQAAMPTASAVTCNGFECARIGGGTGACFQLFDFVYCETTINGQGEPDCEGTINCDP